MKAPTSWLKNYVDLPADFDKVAEILTLAGLEVDSVDNVHFSFSRVIIVQIETIEPHPNAKKLNLATVNTGKGKQTIVCGDPSIREQDIVPLAQVGSVITDGDGNTLEVSGRKIRDVVSEGMLCSAFELGLSRTQGDVLKLPQRAPLGESLATFLTDPTFNIALTPNLGFCRSMFGIAREIHAHMGVDLTLPKISVTESTSTKTQDKVSLHVQAPEACPHYACRIVEGVNVGPSPDWLVDLLEKAGYQSVNNVVDVTNYVMHEIGLPLHAFDYKKLASQNIGVRFAHAGEALVALNQKQYTLTESNLVITDDDKPVAIAGVMGGLETAVTESTHTILLEGARFSSHVIRKSSKDLGLRSEASTRFENKVDPQSIHLALDRAASMIKDLAQGKVLAKIAESVSSTYKPCVISSTLSKINSFLGLQLSLGEVETILERLGFSVITDEKDSYQIKVPSFRTDIEKEIDIIEEVGRMYGYNNFPRIQPKHEDSPVAHHKGYVFEKNLREKMCILGYQEWVTCNLISPKLCNLEIENGLFHKDYVEVLHAKSQDQSILRPSLLPNFLDVIKTNQNHKCFNIKSFEIGKVHYKQNAYFQERWTLGIALQGKTQPHHFSQEDVSFDFFHIKGAVQMLLQELSVDNVSFQKSSFKTFHPGQQGVFSCEKEVFAICGQVHPSTLDYIGIREPVFFAEVDLEILDKYRTKKRAFQELPKFPSSERDWTVGVNKSHNLDKLFAKIDSLDSYLLKKTELLDIYEQKDSAEKNITLRFTYRDDAKTVDMDAIEKEHQKIIQELAKVL